MQFLCNRILQSSTHQNKCIFFKIGSLNNTLNFCTLAMKISMGPCLLPEAFYHSLLVQTFLSTIIHFFSPGKNISSSSFPEWCGRPFFLLDAPLRVSNCSAWREISEHAGECAKLAHAFSESVQDILRKQRSSTHTCYCVDVSCWCVWQFTTSKSLNCKTTTSWNLAALTFFFWSLETYIFFLRCAVFTFLGF